MSKDAPNDEQFSDENNLNERNESETYYTTSTHTDVPQSPKNHQEIENQQPKPIPNEPTNNNHNNRPLNEPLQGSISNPTNPLIQSSGKFNSTQNSQFQPENQDQNWEELFFYPELLWKYVVPQNDDSKNESRFQSNNPQKESISMEIPPESESNPVNREASERHLSEETKKFNDKTPEMRNSKNGENLEEHHDDQDQLKENNEDDFLENKTVTAQPTILDNNFIVRPQRDCKTTGELRKENNERKSELSQTSEKKVKTEAQLSSQDNLKNQVEESEESEMIIRNPKRRQPKKKAKGGLSPNDKFKRDDINELNNEDDNSDKETNKESRDPISKTPHIQESDKKLNLADLTYKAKRKLYKQFLIQNKYEQLFNLSLAAFKKEKENQNGIQKSNSIETPSKIELDSPNLNPIEIPAEEEKNMENKVSDEIPKAIPKEKKEKKNQQSLNIHNLTAENIASFIKFIENGGSYDQMVEDFLSDSENLISETYNNLVKSGLKITWEDFKKNLEQYFKGQKMK